MKQLHPIRCAIYRFVLMVVALASLGGTLALISAMWLSLTLRPLDEKKA